MVAIQATLTTAIPAPGFLFDVAFSPDGRWLALATDGKRVPVVEVATERTRLAIRHGSWRGRGVLGVAFSPDGRWLAVGGGDTARVWDAHSGEELLVVHNEASPEGMGSMSVAFSADGRLLATSGRSGRRGMDHVVRVWQLHENPTGAPTPPSAPGGAAPARVRGRVDLASERSRSVEAPVGAVRVSQRTRRLKERLRAAAVGRLAQGEELRGVLLDVPRGQVSMPLPFVVRFDETVGHAPISLSFRGEFAPEGIILHRALASSEA